MTYELARTFALSPEQQTKIEKRLNKYIEESQAKNTTRAYNSDWQDFVKWCMAEGVECLPSAPEAIASYLVELAEERNYTMSTLQRRLSSIVMAHKSAQYPSPAEDIGFQKFWRGLRRHYGTAQYGKKALLTEDIKQIVGKLDVSTLAGLRDRALILVGFSGAFRRTELVALDVQDVEFTRDGMVLNIRRSKTDQEAIGRKVAIPYGSTLLTCPVQALREWLKFAMITDGPLFRKVNKSDWAESRRLSDKSVSNIVKKLVEVIGKEPAHYAGHSLRSGFATSSASAGANERDIMRQTGHKSVSTVRRYIRDGELFRNNAAASLGL